MPTITEVSDEVPVAVPSDGTEDVVQGHVVEQEGKSNDSDNESADDSSSSTTSDEDQSDSSSNDETSSNSDSDKSTDSSDMEFDEERDGHSNQFIKHHEEFKQISKLIMKDAKHFKLDKRFTKRKSTTSTSKSPVARKLPFDSPFKRKKGDDFTTSEDSDDDGYESGSYASTDEESDSDDDSVCSSIDYDCSSDDTGDSEAESISEDSKDSTTSEEAISEQEKEARYQEKRAHKKRKKDVEKSVADIDTIEASIDSNLTLDLASKAIMKNLMETLRKSNKAQSDLVSSNWELNKKQQDLKDQAAKIAKAAKSKSTKAKSYSGIPKGLTSPSFPERLTFNPDKKGKDDIVTFFEDFEEICEHVQPQYRTHFLFKQLHKDVTTVLRQYRRTYKKKNKRKMSYKATKSWLFKNYKKRGAKSAAYAKLDDITQGTTTVQSYVTKLGAAFVHLEEMGHTIDKLSRRQRLVNGLRTKLRNEAKKWPDFYDMKQSALVKKLKSLDESLKDSEKGHEANVATISTKEFNKMKERVVFLEKKGKAHKVDHSSDDETAAAVDTRSERDKMISTNKMKRFYSEEIFKERLKYSVKKGDPRKKPEYYNKDEYEGEKVCILCKKSGHTLDTCKLWVKKYSK